MDTDFSGQVVVVTGAGRGIGRATALALAERGASVVVADLDADVADEVADEIAGKGGKAGSVAASVADWTDAGRIVDTAVTGFGRIDALINNAGYLARASIWEYTPEEFEAQVGVHIFGAFYCTRHALPHMMAQGYGRIVNVVSRAGLVGADRSSAYATGKGGVFGFTNAIARDLVGTGINVNAFNPAATATRLSFANQTPEVVERLKQVAQEPEHVAAMATFLASRACDFSGQTFFVERGAVGPLPVVKPDRTAYTNGMWTPEDLAAIMPRFEFPQLAKSLYVPDPDAAKD
jgi:NAD(P)-dependent dehydrogenase (short-subunit alcohol dehydrogenase family)